MSTINERIESLRKEMKAKKISAYIILGSDPHASEYIADCWKEREWISGFNGSAGNAAVTLEKSALWTDSRYFLQASEQLSVSEMQLMKMGLPETPQLNTWICEELKSGDNVGVNPEMISASAFKSLEKELSSKDIHLVALDLISPVWQNRPEIPAAPLFIHPLEYSGASVSEKLEMLRYEMKKMNSDTFVMSALDDIAWLFNIRGNDVDYNPVVISYAIITLTDSTLFVDSQKVNKKNLKILQEEGVYVTDYKNITLSLENLSVISRVLIDGAKLNQALYEAIPRICEIKSEMSPVFRLKSIKNNTQTNGIRQAMIRDGVALTKFFIWLESAVKTGKQSEISISKKLREFRAEQKDFFGESFGTICGYAGHGAIVHYSATPESDAKILPGEILLLDSGGQYLDGTTDITRTVSLGNPTEQQKTDFTLVLKGHVSLGSAQFPQGTRGSQLDILARKAMWDRKINYGHGTGHGVGHFLNVHEGPQSIRMDENPVTLQAGMILSNEPGLYRTGLHGIRTENLVLVTETGQSEFGSFMGFETLTLFPIDKSLIIKELLTKDEIDWINDYHKMVYERLKPNLTEAETEWLSDKCSQIQ